MHTNKKNTFWDFRGFVDMAGFNLSRLWDIGVSTHFKSNSSKTLSKKWVPIETTVNCFLFQLNLSGVLNRNGDVLLEREVTVVHCDGGRYLKILADNKYCMLCIDRCNVPLVTVRTVLQEFQDNFILPPSIL